VREALDQAANIVVSRFGDQREVQAAIQHVIGATYLSMTRFPQAESHLREALRLRSYDSSFMRCSLL